jgi:hypothetical protein
LAEELHEAGRDQVEDVVQSATDLEKIDEISA